MKRDVLKMFGLALAVCLAVTGCGADPASPAASDAAVPQQASGTEELPGEAAKGEIELLEPVVVSENWEKAARRDLMEAAYYSAQIYPYTEEYTFGYDVRMGEMKVLPGQAVQKGDLLAVADTEALQESLEELSEQLSQMDKEYLKYKEQVEEELVEPEGEARRLGDIVAAYEKAKPPMYAPSAGNGQADGDGSLGEVSGGDLPGGADAGSTGSAGADGTEAGGSSVGGTDAGAGGSSEPVMTEQYLQWEQEYNQFNGRYRILSHQNNTKRLALEQRTQLYELDREYLLGRIRRIQAQISQYEIRSGMDGEVVALRLRGGRATGSSFGSGSRQDLSIGPESFCESGTALGRDDVVAVVGDGSRKVLIADFVSSALVGNAKEMYALINGRRYSVEYQPMSAEEVKDYGSGKDVYTTYLLEEGADVSLGDVAYVVLVSDSREDALSVPLSSVHRENGSVFVYRKGADGSEMTPVTTGMDDGVYVEILSGLSEGDEVSVEEPWKVRSDRKVLEATKVESDVETIGNLMFSTTYHVKNPVEYGTVYLQEWLVNSYQQVQKGDVVATVQVVGDDIYLKRLEVQVQRMKERLEDLAQKGREEDEDAILEQQEAIADLEKEIQDRKRDYATTQILSPYDGIILTPNRSRLSSGDILENGQSLLEIASLDSCYLALPDLGYSYGTQVELSYEMQTSISVYHEEAVQEGKEEGNVEEFVNWTLENLMENGEVYMDLYGLFDDMMGTEELSFPGKVVYLGQRGAKEGVRSEYTLLQIPSDAAQEILRDIVAISRIFQMYRYSDAIDLAVLLRDEDPVAALTDLVVQADAQFLDDAALFGVNVHGKLIEDGLLVPASSMKIREGKTYVLVEREDGEVVAQSFLGIPGIVTNSYWVLDGLTEGTKICLE